MKTDYSVECEVCGSYNISPIKCKECWKKEIVKQVQDILVELENSYDWRTIQEVKKKLEII